MIAVIKILAWISGVSLFSLYNELELLITFCTLIVFVFERIVTISITHVHVLGTALV